MKARTAILLILTEASIVTTSAPFGAMSKIQDWPYAWVWQLVAWIFSAVMAFVVAMKVLRYPGFKDFLDQ